MLDGEIVVPGKNGVPDALPLRSAMSRGQDRLLYYAFDLLHLDGYELRAPLADRRGVLAQLLIGSPGRRILMSETINFGEPPARLFQHACDLGMEGLVAKRVDAPYRSGRVQSWIKVKCIAVLHYRSSVSCHRRETRLPPFGLAATTAASFSKPAKPGQASRSRAESDRRDRLHRAH